MTVPAEPGLARRLALGFGAQGMTLVLLTLLQFLLVPAFLSAWPTALYADWLVLYAAAGLLSLADFGLQGYFTNALRLAWACGRAARFHRVLGTGLAAYALLVAALAGTVLAAGAAADLPALLGVTALAEASAVLLLLALSTILLLPRGLVAAVYSARGAFGRETGLGLCLYAGQFIAQAAALLAGGTPLMVAAAHGAASLVLGWGLLLLDLRRRHPDVLPVPRRPRRMEWRRLGARAPLYGLSLAASVLLLHVPVMALGRLAPPAEAVVAFTTMRTFVGLPRQAALFLSIAAGLEMARQHVRGDRDGTIRLHAATARLTGGLAGLLSGLVLGIGPVFFSLWTHGGLAFDAPLAMIFLGAVVLMAPAHGAWGFLRHTEHARPVAAAHLAQVALAIPLCLMLVPRFAASGAALAVAVAELLTQGLYLLPAMARLVKMPLPALAGRTYGMTLACLALGYGAARAAEALVAPAGLAGLTGMAVLWGGLAVPPAVLILRPVIRAIV